MIVNYYHHFLCNGVDKYSTSSRPVALQPDFQHNYFTNFRLHIILFMKMLEKIQHYSLLLLNLSFFWIYWLGGLWQADPPQKRHTKQP